jgi:hypothetical protein
MQNVTELRNQLAEVFADLRAGNIEHKNAAELANLAGKMINSAKTQLEYYAQREETPNIPFLSESNNGNT